MNVSGLQSGPQAEGRECRQSRLYWGDCYVNALYLKVLFARTNHRPHTG
jgi:hypothetical protein